MDGKVAEYTYTAAEGDAIPNGDMSKWTTRNAPQAIIFPAKDVPYPNEEGKNFWDSGNNAAAILCVESNGAANLEATTVMGLFAPGNMYTGRFEQAGIAGTAHFGQVYNWTARPAALKVSYKANVGVINNVGTQDPDGDQYNEKQDVSCIYAVVVDWSAQHPVKSGMTTPTGMWDPSTAKSLDEGAILGYAILDITESTEGDALVETLIPFTWYDKEAKPASGHYSVVISCATSKRGDYLTGCSTNKLWVDNFAWGY